MLISFFNEWAQVVSISLINQKGTCLASLVITMFYTPNIMDAKDEAPACTQAEASLLILAIRLMVDCSLCRKILAFPSFHISQITSMASVLDAFLGVSTVMVIAIHQSCFVSV